MTSTLDLSRSHSKAIVAAPEFLAESSDLPTSEHRQTAENAPTAENLAADPNSRGWLGELSAFYRQIGFEAGYAQAARDQLDSAVVIAEQVLREHNLGIEPIDARKLLYAFVARMDRRLGLFASPATSSVAEGYLEGGLGI